MNARILVLILASIILVGCHRSADGPPRPVADQSTPDNAIKSFWADGGWQRCVESMRLLEYLNTRTFFAARPLDHLRQVTQSEIDSAGTSRNLSIDKVDIQSESRAVVWALGPPNPGNTKPAKTQYLLTRQDKQWVIEDILTECYICDGSGEETDHEQQMKDIERDIYTTNPKRTCHVCGGKGWRSVVF